MPTANAIAVQEGVVLDYTPAAAVDAGAVVNLGNLIGITSAPIAASVVGALCIDGVFSFLKSGSSGPVFAIGDEVFWDYVNNLAKRTGGSGMWHLGTCTAAAGASDTRVSVRLRPHGLPAAMVGKVFEDVTLAGGSKTLDIEDNGKVMNITVGSATNVVTLPATAIGNEFIVRNGTAGERVALSPASVDKIFGADLAGVDNKDRILAAATSKVGDYCILVAEGVNGYCVRGERGVWTAEP